MPKKPAKVLSKSLMVEIRRALENVDGFGSIEIYVQDNKVVQITQRNIKKIKESLIGQKTRP